MVWYVEIRHGVLPEGINKVRPQQRIRLVHGEYMSTQAYPGEQTPQGVPHRFRKLFKIDHPCNAGLQHSVFAMKKNSARTHT